MLHRLGAGRFALDCRGLRCPEALFDVFSQTQSCLDASLKRLVFVADSAPIGPGGDTAAAVTAASIEGLAKSVAREVGRGGAQVNTVYIPQRSTLAYGAALPQAAEWLADPQRCRFITGQSLQLDAFDTPPPALPSLAGKTVLITGASGGIGAALCQASARLGCSTLLAVDSPGTADKASELLSGIGAACPGTSTAFFQADLSRADSPELAAEVLSFVRGSGGGGRVDAVVHCAGVTLDKTLKRMPESHWVTSLRVNLANPMHITDALMREGAMGDDATMVAISSIIGISGNRGQSHYAAGKRGLREWVQALSAGSNGLRAYAVAPGFIQTPMAAALPEAVLMSMVSQSAMEALGEPEDVADIATTLLSPAGAALKAGQTIRVCGGNFWGS